MAEGTVYSYVAIRADEPERLGYHATHPNLNVQYPFREHGIDKAGVIDLLNASDLGLPDYYKMALAQRLHLLLLPTEDRMGAPQARTSRCIRRSQALRKNGPRTRFALYLERPRIPFRT